MLYFIVSLLCFAFHLINSAHYTKLETCSNEKCRLPYCYCSSQTIPGSLTPRNTPQFLSISINGPIDVTVFNLSQKIFHVNEFKNPDGCPISGTIFLKNHAETDYCLVQKLVQRGFELSITSNSSECPTMDCRIKPKSDKTPFVSWRKGRWYNEIILFREMIQNRTRIHPSTIVGHRSPNYEINLRNIHYQILRENKFLYDSTLVVNEPGLTYTSQQPSPLTWPHTMDFAPTYDCSQGCYTQSFPGLWTIPIHMYQDTEGRNCTTIGSDHCRMPRTVNGFFNYLKHNFNRHYHSNHAPFIIALESSWINEAHQEWRLEGLMQFVKHILKYHKHDVYFVRMIDIINWMLKPIELKQMKNDGGYLSSISLVKNCNSTLISAQYYCSNEKDDLLVKKQNNSLWLNDDITGEQLFSSNIVSYTIIFFLFLTVVIYVYDHFII